MSGHERELFDAVRVLQGDEGQWGLTPQADPVAESARHMSLRTGLFLAPPLPVAPPNPQLLSEPVLAKQEEAEPQEDDWSLLPPTGSAETFDELRQDLTPALLHPMIPRAPTSPTTLGAAAEGSEAAVTDTWTTDGITGLEVYVICRVVYNHAGDKKLYSYARKLTYDIYGRLYSVGGETRIEVDAAGAC